MESRFRFSIKLNELKADLIREIDFLNRLVYNPFFTINALLLRLNLIDHYLETLIKSLFIISNGDGRGNSGLIMLKIECDRYLSVKSDKLPSVLAHSLETTQKICAKLRSELNNVPLELTQEDEDVYQAANLVRKARM
jgi:hypothetical protein